MQVEILESTTIELEPVYSYENIFDWEPGTIFETIVDIPCKFYIVILNEEYFLAVHREDPTRLTTFNIDEDNGWKHHNFRRVTDKQIRITYP